MYEKAFSLSLRVWVGIHAQRLPSSPICRKCRSKWFTKTAAIAAITSNPAEIFKLNYSGNIREGEVANLVLWSGDPFELTSEAEMVMIAGEKIKMVSRSLQLRDRYYENIRNFIETESRGE